MDLATLKLAQPAVGHVFRISSSGPRAGTYLGMVGYPLGNRLSLNQGKIRWVGERDGVPTLEVTMLGGEGASGAPFIDDRGFVVGVLQHGLGVWGQQTAGVLVGVNLASLWGLQLRLSLCRNYPNGGIVGCPGAAEGSPITASTARKIAAEGVLWRADLTPTWTLSSSSTRTFDTDTECKDFIQGGYLARREDIFETSAGDVLSGNITVYETPSDARSAFQLITSNASIECLTAAVRHGLAESLKAPRKLGSFSAHRTASSSLLSRDGFGDAASSYYFEWQVTGASAADELVGHSYWSDVLVGDSVLTFQLGTYRKMKLAHFTSALVSTIARVAGYPRT